MKIELNIDTDILGQIISDLTIAASLIYTEYEDERHVELANRLDDYAEELCSHIPEVEDDDGE